jgi:hypothetical protein
MAMLVNSSLYATRLMTSSRLLPNVMTGVLATSMQFQEDIAKMAVADASSASSVPVADVASLNAKKTEEPAYRYMTAEEGWNMMTRQDYKKYLEFRFDAEVTKEEAEAQRQKVLLNARVRKLMDHKVMVNEDFLKVKVIKPEQKNDLLEKIHTAELHCIERLNKS